MSLNRRTPLKGGSGFKSKGNGLKSKSMLKSSSSLKSSYSLKSNSKLESKSKINHKSSKQVRIDRDYRRVCLEISKEREHVCTGCMSIYGLDNLTHSHLIPRSRRRDLVANKKNITYHCIVNGCHEKWECDGRVELLDYEKNMEVVKSLDLEYYMIISR